MNYDATLGKLERDLEGLRVDLERFANGALLEPPLDLEEDLKARIRKLRSSTMVALADQFRLNAVEARLSSLLERHRRRSLARESGRPTPESRRAAAPTSPAVVIGKKPENRAVEALFTQLHGREPEGSGDDDLERFHASLQKQLQKIRKSTGCEEVRLWVSSEDGRVRLKAKPVRKNRT